MQVQGGANITSEGGLKSRLIPAPPHLVGPEDATTIRAKTLFAFSWGSAWEQNHKHCFSKQDRPACEALSR